MTSIDYKNAVEQLKKYSYHYYVLDDPITTDEEYDILYHTVVAYESAHPDEIIPDSPTQRVGDLPQDKFDKAQHLSRMWSLEDLFNQEELDKWVERITKVYGDVRFYCEPKFDGASLNLIYDNGTLGTGDHARGWGRGGRCDPKCQNDTKYPSLYRLSRTY